MNRARAIGLAAALGGLMLARTPPAFGQAEPDAATPTPTPSVDAAGEVDPTTKAEAAKRLTRTLHRFADHVASTDRLDPEPKQALVAELRRAAADAEPRDARELEGRMNEAVRRMYPAYGEALRQLGMERIDAAAEQLRALAQSDDPYLAAHAGFYLARAHAMREQFEQALPLLERLTGEQADYHLADGEATFLKGVALAETLRRDEAIATLKRFVSEYPFSSERTLIGALHLIDELSYIRDGSLHDVRDRMDWSRRRLAHAAAGPRTQAGQERIVAMLDRLIEQAEQQEQQGGGGGGGGQGAPQPGGSSGGNPSGNQQPSGPANESAAPAGESRMGSLHRIHRGDPDDAWGEARDRDREEVLNAIRARYPERYRELVEQYYRSLQEEGR